MKKEVKEVESLLRSKRFIINRLKELDGKLYYYDLIEKYVIELESINEQLEEYDLMALGQNGGENNE